MLKKLTVRDFDLIEKLIPPGDQRIAFGSAKMSRDRYLDYTMRCITSQNHSTYFSYNNDDVKMEHPLSMVTVLDFESQPAWAAINFKVFQGPATFNAAKNGWFYFGEVFELKEKEGRYNFYYLKSVRPVSQKRWVKTILDQGKDFGFDIFNRYKSSIEEYIPAGQQSKFDIFKTSLFRNQIFPDDTVVMCWSCLQKFRDPASLGMPETMQDIWKEIDV
jgi:hypothetical protein